MKRAFSHAALGLALVLAFGGHADAKTRHASPVSSSNLVLMQDRLEQFGFHAGPRDGLMSADMRNAVAQFQKSVGMKSTGILNKATIALLTAPSTAPALAMNTAGRGYNAQPIAYASPANGPYQLNMFSGTQMYQGAYQGYTGSR